MLNRDWFLHATFTGPAGRGRGRGGPVRGRGRGRGRR